MTFRVARDFIGWLRSWFGLFIKDISTVLTKASLIYTNETIGNLNFKNCVCSKIGQKTHKRQMGITANFLSRFFFFDYE